MASGGGHLQQQRSWLWGLLFVLLGLLNLAMYLYRGGAELHSLVIGIGLLLIAPYGALHFRGGDRLTIGLGMLGMTLVAIGIFVH
ncbi:MAG: hypothetical protein ABI114_17985 [Rhodanobacter sp.]